MSLFAKDANTQQIPASTIKIITAIICRDWVTNLDSTVTVTVADLVDPITNSNMSLQANDVISYRDLLYGLMIPSANDGANCIARNVGALIIAGSGPGTSTDPSTRFIQAMSARAAALGMASTTIVDASGIGRANRSTAADLARAMGQYSADSTLVTIGGTVSRLITITGVNARTYTVNGIQDDMISVVPETLSVKNGFVNYTAPVETSGHCYALLWAASGGQRRITVTLNAPNGEASREDLKQLVAYQIARITQGFE